MKKTIYQMIMECFEICLPLSNKASSEKYIELTDIIIPNIIENYNEYLLIKIHINPSKIRDTIEKIKLCQNGKKHPEIIKNLMQREIRNLYPKDKIKIKEYGLYKDWEKICEKRSYKNQIT